MREQQGEHDTGETGDVDGAAQRGAALRRTGTPLGSRESHVRPEGLLYWTPDEQNG